MSHLIPKRIHLAPLVHNEVVGLERTELPFDLLFRTAPFCLHASTPPLRLQEWVEGSSGAGRWVACTHEHLVAAVRFLVVQERLQQLREAASAVDAAWIESQIQRIRTSLGKIKNIKTKGTNIRDGANDIEGEADALRSDINGALSEMENALKAAGNSAETL